MIIAKLGNLFNSLTLAKFFKKVYKIQTVIVFLILVVLNF